MSDKNLETEKTEMTGHVYDGIAECDNPMPGWWVWTFLLTIIFAFIYYIHYEVSGAPTLKQELAIAMREIENAKAKHPVLLESEDQLKDRMSKDGVLNLGAATYVAKCAACHGKDLQGSIGPNLTDKYWIHGRGSRIDLVNVVREGVVEKGMPAWSQMISADEVYAVAAYVLSKQGSNPANPKAPQGELAE